MIVSYGIYILYLLFLSGLFISWSRLVVHEKTKEELMISVIVPFRNEAQNLPRLLNSLNQQSHSCFEVIFINDHSDDNGVDILQSSLSDLKMESRVFSLDTTHGKKAAISKGILESKNDLIITTDADCVMKMNWLKEMSGPFNNGDVKMVVGPVELSGHTMWQKMQSLESSALVGVGGGMINFGKPTMSNGANLAYRKRAFEEVSGFSKIDSTPSGDDELLMMKVFKEHKNGIRFLKSEEALVSTAAEKSWPDFKQQRLRWASKWNVGKRASTLITAILIFLVQLAQLSIVTGLVLGFLALELGLMLISTKFIIEFLFVWQVRKSFGQRMFMIPFFLNYVFYPFYALYFGVAANFGDFQWKDRNYKV